MTAKFLYQYNIDPSFDLTNFTAQQAQDLMLSLWGNLEPQRQTLVNTLVSNNLTDGFFKFATLLDRENRKYYSSRNVSDPNAPDVIAYRDFHLNILPNVVGPFTKEFVVIIDGENIDNEPQFQTL